MGRAVCLLLLFCLLTLIEAPTGPQTEKRFPPLKLPEGFRATLFACDPLIEYPSVISLGPRTGSLFVAVDYMTGLGTDIVRRDEIRLVEDTDGDGYADKATVFATGFNSIQGIAYHRDTVYVMHAPYLTAVRDTKGTGKADEQRHLLTGLGLAPEVDQIRLHNANGVVVGHDGWLYLALGDRGCDVKRPEGDRLVLNGGGILRCRPDGKDLHVFSTGLRNIYDVALDEELNVFTRDNENDGGDYKIRVCHSFFGADHGYPYLYHERPDEALAPLADLGLGSAAGGVCYLETQFPAEYRGNLFFCEWGRSVVRYPLKRSGATFASHRETDFAAGAPTDTYGFKPTDLVVDYDGSLFASDWADGQRPKRGRGRIYRIQHVGDKKSSRAEDPLTGLNSESYHERCSAQSVLARRSGGVVVAAWEKQQLGERARLHAVWLLSREELHARLKVEIEPRVQAQIIHALADIVDPVLAKHRLDAGRGDPHIAADLAKFAVGRDPRVVLETVLLLGRLRWQDAPAWLRRHVDKPDAALEHAAQWTLRRADDWPAVLKLLDESGHDAFRKIALRAMAEQYSPVLVDGLLARLKERPEYAELLARVYQKPATPWVYWGFRPQPRPANTVVWERTAAIATALDNVLRQGERAVRLPLLKRMLREKVPATTAALAQWLQSDRDAESVTAILAALGTRPAAETRGLLDEVIVERRHAMANRLLATSLYLQGLDAANEKQLLVLAEKVNDGPVLAEILRALGTRPGLRDAAKLLLTHTTGSAAEVRASAIEALARLEVRAAVESVQKLLADSDARVRSAAAFAAGKLAVRPAADALLRLARDANADVRRSALEALRQLREERVLPLAVAALGDPETGLQALECVGQLGGLEQLAAVTELARRQPSTEMLAAVGTVLTNWRGTKEIEAKGRAKLDRAFAEIHGGSGVLLGWFVQSVAPQDATAQVESLGRGESPDWRLVLSSGIDARVRPGNAPDRVWLAYTQIVVAEPMRVEMFAASSSPATIWLNGKVSYQRDKPGVIGPYPDRFEAALSKGVNRVVVRLAGDKAATEFQLRFRQRTATPERERLALAALARAGNPARGREVFLNADKSLCVKCHRVGEQGERIGPELTGLGNRFSKIHIVESVLEPSRTIAPSFETLAIELKSGKVLNGVRVAEDDASVTIADNEGRKQVIPKRDIEEQKRQPLSTMPEGLEKRLSEDEFVDLISYLVNLKSGR